MAEGEEAYVLATQDTLGKLISKPKMTEKYLKKPPFRFLHDIVMEVTRSTSFGQGLFSAEESDAAQLSDKAAKVEFLNKAINVTCIALGEKVDVSASKIVAGLEAEKTNAWLQKLHQAATTCVGAKSDDAVERVKNGESVTGKKDKEKKEKTEKKEKKEEGGEEKKEEKEEKKEKKEKKEKEEKKEKKEKTEKPEEEKKEGEGDKEKEKKDKKEKKEKEEKEKKEKKEEGAGGEEGGDAAEEERKKKEKEEARRKKREEEKKKKKEEEEAAAKAAAEEGGAEPAEASPDAAAEEEKKRKKDEERKKKEEDKRRREEKKKQQEDKARQDAELQEHEAAQRQAEEAQMAAAQAQQQAELQQSMAAQQAAQHIANAQQGADEEPPQGSEFGRGTPLQDEMGGYGGQEEEPQRNLRPERPRTAGRRPPKVQSKVQTSSETSAAEKPVAPIIMAEGTKEDDDDDCFEAAPGEQVGLSSTGKLNAEDGMHGKFVSNLLAEKKKEEEAERLKREEEATREEFDDQQGKGIRMGKLKRKDKGKDSQVVDVDVIKLGEIIQNLCQAANPLGKSIDLVHQDIANMQKELDHWKMEYREASDQFQNQLRQTEDVLQPLYRKLAELDDRIAEQKNKIRNSRSRISKNDVKIQTLLESVVMTNR